MYMYVHTRLAIFDVMYIVTIVAKEIFIFQHNPTIELLILQPACDYYDSMITRISNIDLSSCNPRGTSLARVSARNNIVLPSDRQIKFVDAQRFDLPPRGIDGGIRISPFTRLPLLHCSGM